VIQALLKGNDQEAQSRNAMWHFFNQSVQPHQLANQQEFDAYGALFVYESSKD